MSQPLSSTTADALLDKLSSDDAFRARFQANPREATRSLGTNDPAVDFLPEGPMTDLADKQALTGARKHFRKALVESWAPFEPVSLCSNPEIRLAA